MTPEVRRRVIRWIAQAAVGLVGYGLVLFIAAGRLDWAWGWVYLGEMAAFLVAHPLVLVPIHAELLAERQRGMWAPGTKRWDRWITTLSGGLMFVPWIVAGLDLRLGWTAGLPLGVHLAGLAVLVAGDALFVWGMAANAFFAEGVRIQDERGHAVATGGPYRYVRHPGYVGAILRLLSTPLVLGSTWAMLPAVLSAALFVLRTALEDRTLQAELPGYADFCQQTRWRLVPGVW